jgi:probable HAF family extracellular repeat protein
MGNRRTLVFALSTLLIAAAWPQQALAEHQIATIDPPGAGTAQGQGTFPIQILNSGVVVGFYVDAKNVSHGFLRSAHGKYTTIDVPESTGTTAYGINDEGTVVGWWADANGVYHGYLRNDHGTFTIFETPGPGAQQATFPLATINFPLAINPQWNSERSLCRRE